MLEGKRLVFREPGVAVIEPFELDDRNLGPTEVVVRTRVSAISPGTELALLQGKQAMHTEDPLPYPMAWIGYSNIGTVVAAGEKVPVEPGQRVFSMAYHHSVVRFDATKPFQVCVPVPDGLADEDAVFARLMMVSMTTMRTTVARGGDGVAVVGLGLIGNLAAQVFQTCGMRVNAFDLSAARRTIAERCGIRSVAPPTEMSRFARRHRLVVEATGLAGPLADAIDLAQDGGEIVMIGAPWGGEANSVPSSRLTRAIFYRFLRLRSGSEWELPMQPAPLAIGSVYENGVTALEWLRDGRVNVRPLVTHRITPEEMPSAYQGLLERKDEYLGVLVRWS